MTFRSGPTQPIAALLYGWRAFRSVAGILQHGAQLVGMNVAGLKQTGYLRALWPLSPVGRSRITRRALLAVGLSRFRPVGVNPDRLEPIITTAAAIRQPHEP